MTPKEQAVDILDKAFEGYERSPLNPVRLIELRDRIAAALAAEREACAMHVFTHSLAEFAGDTIPAQITHRTGLANSIRYRDRKDGAE